MTKTGRFFRSATAAVVILALSSLADPLFVYAHNLQVQMTYMFLDKDTQACLDARIANTTLPVGCAPLSGGAWTPGTPILQIGDIVGMFIKVSPDPAGTNTGVGGHADFYVPNGVTVIDAAYMLPDGSGGFVRAPIKGQSPIAVGAGAIGAKATSQLIGLSGTYTNINGVTESPVTAAGVHRGTLAGVYGDTGIFYSSDPDTAWGSWQTFTGALTGVCGSLALHPTATGATITNNSGDVVVPCNKWDAGQLFAWGAKGTTYPGGTTSPAGVSSPIVDYLDGRGNTPWGFASGVAGPQSGYKWYFDWNQWRGSLRTAADMQAAMAPGKIGPWNRIRYEGSRVSFDTAGSLSTTIGLASIDGSSLGTAVSPATPLPSTINQLGNGPNAIRWAIGQLTQGRPEYVLVKFRIDTLSGAGGVLDASGCPIFHSDSFGGDAGAGDIGKDHLWRYYEPSTFNWNGCVGGAKPATTEFAKAGTTIQYKVKAYNLGTQALHNVTITDTLPSGVTFLSASPAQNSGPNPLVWNVGNWTPGQKFEATVTVRVNSSTNLSNCMVISGLNVSNQPVTQRSCDDTVTTLTPYLIQSKSASAASISPGAPVTYTMTTQNIGNGATGSPVTVTDILPTGFTYSGFVSATVNGASVTPTINSSNTSQPVFTVASAINSGQSLVITFTAATSANLASGSYCNSFVTTQNGIPLTTGSLACVTVAGGLIGDTIFRDWNGNGVQDPGEEGMPGVTVTLGGAASRTTTTDANGNYQFNGLAAGAYTVTVPAPGASGVPAGYTLTADPDGGAATASFAKTLALNETYLGADWGYRPGGAGTIGDKVFDDQNGDGTFNGSDVGINGVTVNLYEDTNGNGTLNAGDNLIATTTTAGGGNYSFTGLDPSRSYLVQALDGVSSPVDTYFLNPYTLTTTNPWSVTPATFTAQGNAVTTADFGYLGTTPGSIGDQVFVDTNGSGTWDAGEPGIPNIGVSLYIDLNGNGQPDGSEFVASTSTDGNGVYSFPNLGPANYIVVLDQADADIPGGYFSTVAQINTTLGVGANYTLADFPFRALLPKSVDKASAANGNTLTFTLKPSYPASDLLTSVRVMDPVPSNTAYLSSIPAAASTGAYTRIAQANGSEPGIGDTSVTTSASTVIVGGTVTVTLNVVNNTGAAANVTPSLTVGGGASACGSPSPANFSITSGGNQNFAWTCALNSVAEYTFTANASDGTNDWPDATSASVLSVASGASTTNIVTWNLGSNTAGVPSEQLISGTVAGVYALAGKVPGGGGQPTNLFSDYSPTGNSWSAKANTTAVVAKGGALTSNGSTLIYALEGNGTQKFRAYTIATNAWSTLTDTGTNVGEGGALQYLTVGGTNYVFALMGNSTGFKRYNVGTPGWAAMVNTPATVKKGGALTTDGTYIYALEGNTNRGFWRCNATTNNVAGACSGASGSWVALTNVPQDVAWGGGLTRVADYIYATTGNNRNFFYRWGPLSGTPVWTAMTVAPGNVSDGGALTNDGTDVYAFQGKTKAFWRYNVATNNWTTLTPVTFASNVGQGGALTYVPGVNPATRNNSLEASSSLVTHGGTFRLTMTLQSTAAVNNVAPTLNAPTATGGAGATCTLQAPTTQNIAANGSATFTWNCSATNIGAIGSLTYTATAAGTGPVTWLAATANSVLVSPELKYTTTIGTFPASCLITNTGIVAEQSGNLGSEPSNTTQTTGTACGATIGDRVWSDTNGNQAQDSGEGGIAGVRVYIDANANGQYDSGETNAFTDVNGFYQFTGLAAATYTVRTDPSTYPAGYTPTTPAFVTQAVAANGSNLNFDFGLRPPAAFTGSIGDYVWLDTNRDGNADPGEQPLPGVTVRLYRDLNGNGAIDVGEPLIGTDVTDANGLYDFTGLAIGSAVGSPVNYVVQVDTASTVTLPYPYTGGPTTSTIGATMSTTTGTPTNSIRSVSLYTGQATVSSADFGYNWSGTIGDTVFYDSNGNGAQNGGETGVPNVTLALVWDQNGNGTVDLGEPALTVAFTNGSGVYAFNDLPPGKYIVQAAGQTVVSPTTANLYGTMVPTSSYGENYAVNLPAGGSVLTADFGFIEAARVEGTVFYDANANSALDGPDSGLSGVTVTLTGTDLNGAAVTRSMVTPSGGGYDFLIPPGTYSITYNPAPVSGTYPTITTPLTIALTAVGGVEYTGNDFGRTYSGSIGNLVWNDNGNGTKDSAESGIPSVTVQLYASNGTTLLATTATNSGGNYSFTGLADGTYVVKVTQPAGYNPVSESETGPMGCGGVCDNTIGNVVVAGGLPNNGADFGYQSIAATFSVSGTVYDDDGAGGGTAGNGIKDGTEPGIVGATVTLYNDPNNNGLVDAGETVFGTTTTAAGGAYVFLGVPAGNYTVKVNTSTLPSTAYVQSGDPDQVGICTICDSQGNVDTGPSAVGKDFGYRATSGTISGAVCDGTGNGLCGDVGDSPLSGVTVFLTFAGADGILGTADDVVTTATTVAVTGVYSFTGLAPGNYQITKINPAGKAALADADGGNPNNISVTLAPGATAATRDFEVTGAAGIIGDSVWLDVDRDGVFDIGEPGLANVSVALWRSTDDNVGGDTLVAVATTDLNGHYLFTNVPPNVAPGKYYVKVDESTLPASGLGVTAGTSNPTTPFINLTAGQSYLNADFGYVGDVTKAIIGNFVWSDANGNGVQDSGEPGIGGVTVTLKTTGGATVATTTTNADGSYYFVNVTPGTYVVDVTGPPAGYTLTTGPQSNTDPTAPITVIAGQTYDEADFGYRNTNLKTITDRVWYDADRDGLQDPGEAGIAGVSVNLYADLDGDGGFTKNVIDGKVDLNGDGVINASDSGSWNGVTLASGVLSQLSGSFNGVTVTGGLLDMNGDGVINSSDTGVIVDEPIIATDITDDAGDIAFTGLQNGKYVMEIADNAGQLVSYQGTTLDAQAYQRAVTVAGANVTGVHFGYAGLGPIGDTVFSDANGNGVQDPGESGIAGVTVKLYRDANGNNVFDPATDSLVATTTTNGSGKYAFNDLVAGTYFVSIDNTTLPGYSPTTTDQEPASATTTEIDVTLTAGVTTIRVIGGSLDMNGDGVINGTDNGFANGVQVFGGLLDLNGSGSTTSNDDGWWNGIRVIDGQLDVNADGAINIGTNGTDNGFVSISQPSFLNADFGYRNVGLADVSGLVWNDLNRNAVYNGPGEPIIPGVTVVLVSCGAGTCSDGDESVVAMTTSAAGTGAYTFPDVKAGSYKVAVTDDAGVLGGYTLTSGLDEIPVTVAAANIIDINFGYVIGSGTASIGDSVWLDANNDGARQPNESGIGGVSARMKDCGPDATCGTGDDGAILTTTTGTNGSYLFSGLSAGNYQVDVTGGVPGGLTISTFTPSPTGVINLSVGQAFLNADFGYKPATNTAVLGDTVWFDVNGNGLQEASEVGIAGVHVLVVAETGGATVADIVTGADGSWLATNLPVGATRYIVYVNTSTLPANVGIVPTNLGGTNDNYITPVLASGQVLTNLDFGYAPAGSGTIGNTVYFDKDGNSSQVPGEPGIPGVTVELLNSAGTTVLATKTTDATGTYSFTGLAPADYRVRVATSPNDQGSALYGLTPTQTQSGLISIACPAGVCNTNNDVDFGFAPTTGGTVTLGGTIWHDTLKPSGENGTLQPGEPGIQGVTVELWLDVNLNGTIQPGTDNLVRTTTSNANGDYLFLGMPPGNYIVRVTDTGGVTTGMTAVLGPAPTVDSNGHVTPYAVTLASGTTNTSVDFAYQATSPVSIAGTVFEDAGGSLGVFNPSPGDDALVPGATVTLYRVVSGVEYLIGSTTTDGDGNYGFGDLPAGGTYRVKVDVTGTLAEGMVETVDPSEPNTGNVVGQVCVVCDSQYTTAPLVGSLTNVNFGYWNGGIVTTPVTLAYFKATPGKKKASVDFEWWTATEVGNLGFELYVEAGKKLVRINPKRIRGKITSTEPVHYTYTAEGVEGDTFWIVDVSTHGGKRVEHGPYKLAKSFGHEPKVTPIDWKKVKKEKADKKSARDQKLRQDASAAVELAASATVTANAVNLVVARDALNADGVRTTYAVSGRVYRATYEALLAAGMDLKKVQHSRLALYNRGQPVPINVIGAGTGKSKDLFVAGSYLEFVGDGEISLYTDESPYRLVVESGSGARMAVDKRTLPATFTAVPFYMERVTLEREAEYTTESPNGDPWIDEYVWAEGGPAALQRSITIDQYVSGAAPAQLEIDVWGSSSLSGNPDHHVVAGLNAQANVADWKFDGLADGTVKVALPEGALRNGSNTLTVTLPFDLDYGADEYGYTGYDVVALNSYSVTYPRRFVARNGQLSFTAAGAAFTVEGLTSNNVSVYRVDGSEASRLATVQVTGSGTSYRASFPGTTSATTYHITSAVVAPRIETVITPVSCAVGGEAKYLVISDEDFINADLQRLVDARRAEGYTAAVVPLGGLYAHYSHGIVDPSAMRACVKDAVDRRGTKAVLLVGSDTYDYLDYLKQGAVSHLPSFYTQTSNFVYWAPADGLVGDTDGDGLPDVAIGRFPVRTTDDLRNMVDRTLQYRTKSYGGTAVFAADRYDAAQRHDFRADSDAIASRLPASWRVQKAYVGELELAGARSALIGAINGGTALTAFVGHSGPAYWTFDGLFTFDDALALSNVDKPTVVTQWGCWNTYYVSPRADSLSHGLMLGGNRGAAAVLGSSTLTEADHETEFGKRLFGAGGLVNAGTTIGDALLRARRDIARDHPDWLDVILGWQLLGDPLLRIAQ